MTKFWAITFVIFNIFIFQVDAHVEIKSLDAKNVERALEEKMQRTDTFFENVSKFFLHYDGPEQPLYHFKIDMLGGHIEVFLSTRTSLSAFIKEHFEQLRSCLSWITFLRVQED